MKKNTTYLKDQYGEVSEMEFENVEAEAKSGLSFLDQSQAVTRFDLYCAVALHALVTKGLPSTVAAVHAKDVAETMIRTLEGTTNV